MDSIEVINMMTRGVGVILEVTYIKNLFIMQDFG